MKKVILYTTGLLVAMSILRVDGRSSAVLGTEICRFEDPKYKCQLANRNDFANITLPEGNCVLNDCSHCHAQTKTYIVDRENRLFIPHRFFLTTEKNENGRTYVYECKERGLDCQCTILDKNCTGSLDYCQKANCDTNSECRCEVQKARAQMIHISRDEKKSVNPILLSFNSCHDNYTPNSMHHRRSRRLLENEDAIFDNGLLKVIFKNPVLTLSDTGTVIIRSTLAETILKVTKDLHVVIPKEFLQEKQSVQITFISQSGKHIQGSIQIDGVYSCRRFQCIICYEFLNNIDCAPMSVKYVVYTVLILSAAITIFYIRLAIRAIWSILGILCAIFYQFYRVIRAIFRLGFLTGALTGNRIRHTTNQVNEYIQREEIGLRQQGGIATNLAIVLLLVVMTADQGHTTCSSHQIIAAQIRNCQATNDPDLEKCKIYTNAQITLKNLGHEACLWLKDEKQKALFSIKMKLRSATCHWSTVRDYYTFESEMSVISELNCAQTETCNWLSKCTRDADFPGLTREAKTFPGIQGCQAMGRNNGCYILHAKSCLFYKIFFKPNWRKAYEVRSITGKSCNYEISLRELYNMTQEVITVSHIAETKNGHINVEVLGAYNQPEIYIPEKLIVTLGNDQHTYLEYAAEPGRPRKSEIGDLQANTTLTNAFIFDPNIATCSFLEDSMHCYKQESFLKQMLHTKKTLLPIVRDFHSLYMEDGILKSRMLTTSPVVLNVNFQDYDFSISTKSVCPEFKSTEIKHTGCYNCGVLSSIKFFAKSICAEGMATVTFQHIKISTQAILLKTEI